MLADSPNTSSFIIIALYNETTSDSRSPDQNRGILVFLSHRLLLQTINITLFLTHLLVLTLHALPPLLSAPFPITSLQRRILRLRVLIRTTTAPPHHSILIVLIITVRQQHLRLPLVLCSSCVQRL